VTSTPREFAERIERECYRGVATVNTICSSFATSKCAELVAARDAELAPKPVTPPAVKEWKFDRFKDGRKKAEGAQVHAATYKEALEKAIDLFAEEGREQGCTFTFTLREPVTPPTSGQAGKTFEEARRDYFVTNKAWTSDEFRVQRDDAFLSGWNAALASKEAEIATKNAELQSVREAYMEIERKLQIKLASAEARIEAAVNVAEVWPTAEWMWEGRGQVQRGPQDCTDELLRALGRKVEP
jgi:hypothetical protein